MHLAEGIPDELYWATTPPERAALVNAFRKVRHRAELGFGLVAAQIENWSGYRKGGTAQPEDYFRSSSDGSRAPVTAEDRARLAHLMGPSKSIRA